MRISQARDRLIKILGWIPSELDDPQLDRSWVQGWKNTKNGCISYNHPCPNTIDELTKLIPKNWWFRIVTAKKGINRGPVHYEVSAHPWHKEKPRFAFSESTIVKALVFLILSILEEENKK